MNRLHRQPICVASALLVPLCVLASPSWLMISGVGPAWGVLWLLPWALVDGPVSGVVAGLSLGLVLDGLSLDPGTQIPALMLLGWWWGRLGRRAAPIQRSLNLGLLAWAGAVVLGLGMLVQIWVQQGFALELGLRSWGVQTLLSQALVTALLAPLLVSFQLLLWRRRAPG